MDGLVRRQWDALTWWLREVDVVAHADTATDLDGWSVGDLVAHLGVGLGLAAEVVPVEAPAEDAAEDLLSLGAYVAAYPGAAADIAAMTRRARDDLGTDPLGGLDAVAARVWPVLATYGPYVRARRGLLRSDDYVVTRLVELVVHGDDLHRALPGTTSPVLAEAAGVVADSLAAAYAERTGRRPAPAAPTTWIRLACGRTPSEDPALPLL